jgi:flagellar biosynthesis/type III secretory pathway protein FliH
VARPPGTGLGEGPPGRLITTWAEKVEAKGYEKGMQAGLREGLETMRTLVLRLLKRRFGRPSCEIATRIAEIRSQQELARLAERVDEADSLTDLGLG